MPRKRKSEEPTASSEDATDTKKQKKDAAKKGMGKKQGSVREAIPDVSGIDMSSTATNKAGQKWNIKLSSWNINGIRAWVEKNGPSYLTQESPDIFCVQETKCNEEKIPDEAKTKGYHTYFSSAEKEGYAGTGLYSKIKPIKVTYGLGDEKHDNEGRVITAEYEKFFFVTSYVPNAGRGLPRLDYRTEEWEPDMRKHLKKLDAKKPVIFCGDLNVAHEEIDIANPKGNKRSAGFTQEERDQFTEMLNEGFIDSFRELYPEEKGAYSYWTYMGNARAKNVGWRLDYFVISKRLLPNLCDSLMRKDVMGSDHCPIVCLLHI